MHHPPSQMICKFPKKLAKTFMFGRPSHAKSPSEEQISWHLLRRLAKTFELWTLNHLKSGPGEPQVWSFWALCLFGRLYVRLCATILWNLYLERLRTSMPLRMEPLCGVLYVWNPCGAVFWSLCVEPGGSETFEPSRVLCEAFERQPLCRTCIGKPQLEPLPGTIKPY